MDRLTRLIAKARAAAVQDADNEDMERRVQEIEHYFDVLRDCEASATDEEREELKAYWMNIRAKYDEGMQCGEPVSGINAMQRFLECMGEEPEPDIYKRARKMTGLDG